MKNNNFTRFCLALAGMFLSNFASQAQTAKIQIIHNSPDYIIDTVDVWANDVKLVDNLVFRKSTALLNIDSGDYIITIAKKFSTDSSALTSLLKVENFRVDTGKTYLSIISGVIDTNSYASNPNGVNRSFALVTTNTFQAAAAAGQVGLSFFNGVPDAPMYDLNKLPNIKVGNDIAYGSLSSQIFSNSGNSLFSFTSADSLVFNGVYRTTTASTQTGVVFTSGIFDTTGNPSSAKLSKLLIAFSNGTVSELVKLTSSAQLIHNSADVTLDSADIYVNGVKVLDNMAFRTATPFLTFNAMVPLSIAIAPKTSTSVANAIYNTQLVLDSTNNYYLIANGVVNTANYVANPNGKNIALKIFTYKGARLMATVSKNTDLLYFHGATDLQTSTARGDGQVLFLSKNDSYGDFHGYNPQIAQDNIPTRLLDATTDSILYTGFANLSIHQGSAGLAFTSGFLKANATTNQNGDTLLMFIAWPNGKVDSIAKSTPTTGIIENEFLSSSISVYPNPSNGSFSLSFSTKKSSTVIASLNDITGKTLTTKTINSNIGVNNIPFSLNDINAGIYFLILSSDSQTYTHKISIIK